MRIQLLLGVQLVLAAMLMWSCFCRLVKTDSDTYREVRWAFLFEGTAAGIVLGAPFLPWLMPEQIHWRPGTTPQWAWLALLASVAAVQIVTSRHWVTAKGVPAAFQRHGTLPRIAGGGLGIAAVALLVAAFVAWPQLAIADAEEQITTPIYRMQPGETVTCVAADGCVVFTRQALLTELASFAEHVCSDKRGPRT